MGIDDMPEEEFFHRLAIELNVDEIEPGTPVLYGGTIEKAHGLWIVSSRIGDDRYTLMSTHNEWERLNADRADITRVEK